MVKISKAQRIIKRLLLANVSSSKKDLYITPLISGRHGIGKSMLVREIAEELHGTYVTIEGGALKEGEITGLPYQYMDENQRISFRFLPYYVIDRIQTIEKEIYSQTNLESKSSSFNGPENQYSNNNISPENKLRLLKDGTIHPYIIFFDEINRTDSQVYKELMNILLTRNVNGYQLPWWVFIIGAMNPATSESLYATNEMDPAQLDRFIKINVGANSNDWLNYAKKNHLSPIIQSYIKENRGDLFSDDSSLDEDIESTPSPRGYDMIDTIIQSFSSTSCFFSEKDNEYKAILEDLKVICEAKLGKEVGRRFFEYYQEQESTVLFADFINDDDNLSKTFTKIQNMSNDLIYSLGKDILTYMKDFTGTLASNWRLATSLENKLKQFIKCLDYTTKNEFAHAFQQMKTRNDLSFSIAFHDIYFDIIQPILKEEAKNQAEFKNL